MQARKLYFYRLMSWLTALGLLLSAWAVLSIELAWIPKVPSSLSVATATGINKVFLSLAYSYIAGVILYWFTVKFPFLVNKSRLAPVIRSKIKDIGDKLLNMTLEFRSDENPSISDIDEIMRQFTKKRWTERCKMPYHVNMRNVTETFIYDYRQVQSAVSSLINDYNDYLSSSQLLLLESLRRCQTTFFFSLVEAIILRLCSGRVFYKKALETSYRKLLEDYNKLYGTQ